MAVTKLFDQALDPTARLNSKIITFTRDMSVANGTVAYTGVGFKPSSVVLIGVVNGALQNTVGLIDALLTGYSMQYSAANTWNYQSAYALAIYVSAGNILLGNISAYGDDGFSVTYGKVGAPTGTATFFALCLR